MDLLGLNSYRLDGGIIKHLFESQLSVAVKDLKLLFKSLFFALNQAISRNIEYFGLGLKAMEYRQRVAVSIHAYLRDSNLSHNEIPFKMLFTF